MIIMWSWWAKTFDLRNRDFDCDSMSYFINYCKFVFEKEINECFNLTFCKNMVEAFGVSDTKRKTKIIYES
jgi:hypothetical protein